ncbi:hypothetical protein PRUPE_1G131400 [Prunus persica]|uniref:DUF7866 domain-containing protein n=1 Tax=Prunus persica TaxID=3760 RepID=A0A251QWK6_PRUPE|nr:hypothetical protein PRUPE_1G131400 [Prunus persica]
MLENLGDLGRVLKESRGGRDLEQPVSWAEYVAGVLGGLRGRPEPENGPKRGRGSFKIFALCLCRGGPKGLCLPSPCWYAINCNIPNRPFGFCPSPDFGLGLGGCPPAPP